MLSLQVHDSRLLCDFERCHIRSHVHARVLELLHNKATQKSPCLSQPRIICCTRQLPVYLLHPSAIWLQCKQWQATVQCTSLNCHKEAAWSSVSSKPRTTNPGGGAPADYTVKGTAFPTLSYSPSSTCNTYTNKQGLSLFHCALTVTESYSWVDGNG